MHSGYPAGFGVRRPTTSVHKSTGPQAGYHKQEVSIETVRKFTAQ